MNYNKFKMDLYGVELKRISGCIPLSKEEEDFALNLLNTLPDYTLENIFLSLRKTIKHFSVNVNLNQLSERTGYSLKQIKTLLGKNE
tara:strand:+ start:117 stop:377 length:261 start_codon:yes stop_codon:yes gene_type:complete